MRKTIIDSRYRILKKIGTGATGNVYKVRDLKRNEILALKILSKQNASSEVVQRFKREFSLLAGFHHPNLCEVYDFGTLKNGRSYFTMEYIDGQNIFNATKDLPHKKIYPWIVQLCRALEYIHAKGLIHYDIKPGNVLVQLTDNKIDNAVVKLMDFGLADERQLEDGTVIKGTFPYIAPEIIKGVSIDHRSDLYSLGVLLYEIFTRGSFHSEKKESFATLLIRETELVSTLPSKIVSSIPRGIDQLILRLLALDPTQRFSRTNEVITEIKRIAHKKFELENEATLEGYLLSSKFVGRDKEMELLKSLYKKALQGEGRVVLITGDAGIGKSRLLNEFKIFTQLEGGYCFTGHSYKERIRPLEPFYDVFKEIINYIGDGVQLRTSLAVLFRMFPNLVNRQLQKGLPKLVSLDPEPERMRTFEALSELVRHTATNLGEMVILLEDLHWADDLTIQFLEYLGRNLESRSILICGTCRKEEIKSNQVLNKMMTTLDNEGCFTQLGLKPLNIKSLYCFLDSMITSKSNSPGLVKYLMEKTSGNPYFAQEIMRSLLRVEKVSIGERIEVSDVRQITMPATIEEIVNKRMKDLQCDALEVAKFAAVLLRGFDYELMRRLTGFDDTQLSKVLWELKTKQILTAENNVYRFYHATLREVVNKHLGVQERKKLNYRVGKAIEILHEDNPKHVIEDLAHYFINARHKKKGVQYGLQAAKKSSMQYVGEQAIKFYRGVLTLLDRSNSTLRFNLLQDLGTIEIISSLFDDAINHYRQALNLKNGAIGLKVKLCSKIGGICEHRSEYKKAVRNYQRGLKFLKKMRPSKLKTLLEADIKIRICRVYQMTGDYNRAETFNFDGLEVPKVDIKNREAIILQAGIYNTLALIEAIKGGRKKIHCERAIVYYKKVYNYYKLLKDEDKMAKMLLNLGVMYRRIFDFRNALNCYKRTVKISEKRGFQASLSVALYNIGNYLLDSCDCSKALDYFQRAFSISKKVSNPAVTVASLLGMGGCYLMLCEHKKSHDFHEKALAMLETTGWKEHKVIAFNYIADIQQVLGNYTTALRLYKKALKTSNDAGYKDGIALSLVGLGSLLIEIGEFKAAKKRINDALTIARSIERKNLEVDCYVHLCRMNLIENDKFGALNYYGQGSRLAQQTGMKQRLLRFWLLASEIFYKEKEYSKGVRFADRVIQGTESTGLKNLYADALLLKAKHELKQDMLSKVEYLQALEGAKKIAEEIGCPEILWMIFYEYGRFFQEHKKNLAALEYYHRCNKIFGDICGKITKESYKKSYLTRPDRDAVITAANEIEKLLD